MLELLGQREANGRFAGWVVVLVVGFSRRVAGGIGLLAAPWLHAAAASSLRSFWTLVTGTGARDGVRGREQIRGT